MFKQALTLTICCLLTVSLSAQCVDGDCASGKSALIDQGNLLVGKFENNQINGQGVTYFEWGAKYVGQFSNSSFNGKGTYYHADGNIENGTWTDGVLTEAVPVNLEANSTTHIVIVGINDYTDQSLSFAVSDANAIHQFFHLPRFTSRHPVSTELILNQDATIENVKKQVQAVAQKAKADESILFFFFGMTENKQLRLTDGTMSLPQVQLLLDMSSADQRMCFVDLSQTSNQEVWTSIKGNNKIATSSEQNQVIVFHKDKEVSIEYDGLRQGLFAHYLIEALKGVADKNADGNITTTEIFKYTNRKINSYSSGGHSLQIFDNPSTVNDPITAFSDEVQ